MEMRRRDSAKAEKASPPRPRKRTHEELTMYGGAGASLLNGDAPETAVGKGIAARGYAGASKQSFEYHVRWRQKVSSTHGFWRKLKVIVIG
ncbi:hypothetical protein [Rhodococcus sp. NPDC127528]|uniref:hypothetical protein n=1 Tax=unclassified Rhodococcus (in: high G+C Gram-positive bacteria) TaxID=192944 RepID=UPI003641DBFE